MANILNNFKASKTGSFLNSFLNSVFFPLITAAVMLLCYYLALDIVAILYIGITGTLVMLLSDDVTPVITDLLFMRTLISWENSPAFGKGESDYYTRPEILAPTIIIVSVLIASLIYRLVKVCLNKKFTLTPVFFGLCALCVSLLLNGAFSDKFNIMSLAYGFILTLLFLGLFAVFKDNIAPTKRSFKNLAYAFFSFSILLVVELLVVYFTEEDLIKDGTINRGLIQFGWGPYTAYGVMLTMCIPAVIYLAGISRYGFAFSAYSVLLVAATLMSCCRQSILSVAVIYPVCVVMLLIKGKNRIANLCIFGACLIAGAVMAGVYWNSIIKILKDLFANLIVDGKPNGSGRFELWNDAVNDFKSAPVFGVGFYKDGFKADIPEMYHNTVLQMLGSCGIVGLIAYAVHRVQTVISFFKNVTVERTFLALIIVGLLLNSLLDIHIFYIFPTMTYSLLIAMLVKSESKQLPADTPIE